MTTFSLPAYIQQQTAAGFVALSNQFVGGDEAPATLKLFNLEFKEDMVLIEAKVYWQHSTITQEVLPYVPKKVKANDWTWAKLHCKEWQPLQNFSPEMVEYFKKLRSIWDELEKKGPITPNLCPWFIPDAQGIAFNLRKEGAIWRIENLNFGSGVWQGKGNSIPSTTFTKKIEGFKAPDFVMPSGASQPQTPAPSEQESIFSF